MESGDRSTTGGDLMITTVKVNCGKCGSIIGEMYNGKDYEVVVHDYVGGFEYDKFNRSIIVPLCENCCKAYIREQVKEQVDRELEGKLIL